MSQIHYMLAKKYSKSIIILLVLLTLVSAFFGCSSKPKKQAKSNQKVQTAQSHVNKAVTTSEQKKIDYEVPIGTLKLTDASKLPAGKFGREHPFLPIISRRQAREELRNNVQPYAPAEKATPKDSTIELNLANRLSRPRSETVPKPPVNLRLTLIMDENTAMFEENKTSKYVSVGDTIGGLKVVEIRSSEVILSDGDKTYPVRLGATFTFQQRT